MIHPTLRTILEKGILAPSADNLQPWKFCIRQPETEKGPGPESGPGPFSVDLFIDESRSKSFCDAGYLAPYISAGAVIENMRVAAQGVNCEVDVEYLPKPSHAPYVARIRFRKKAGESQPHAHAQALESRITNRKFYHPRQEINPAAFRNLEAIVDPTGSDPAVVRQRTNPPGLRRRGQAPSGFRLLWMKRQNPIYPRLARLIGEADQLRFEVERLHEELMEIMRLDPARAGELKDGLDLRTLETGPGGYLLFKIISSWKRLSVANFFGFSRTMKFLSERQMLSSGAAGLLVAPTQEPADFIRGGELMERLWHAITVDGLFIQPMEAIPIFILNFQRTGGADFRPIQRWKVEDMKKRFFRFFGVTDKNGLILFFRMGRASPPSVKSIRRPLESFLIEGEMEKAG